MIYHTHCTDVSTNGGKALRALYCLSFGPKKEYVETDFKPVEYRLGTTLIAFLSTDFASLRAKLLVRTTPMMENQAITEIKNELSTIHALCSPSFLKKSWQTCLMNAWKVLRSCKRNSPPLQMPCSCRTDLSWAPSSVWRSIWAAIFKLPQRSPVWTWRCAQNESCM